MEDSFYIHWWQHSFREYETFAYDWIDRMLEKLKIIATNKRYVINDETNNCSIQLKFNHASECQCGSCSKD